MQDDKKVLEQQVEELNKDLKKVTSERDEASSQYQQYVTSLNSQLQTMASKVYYFSSCFQNFVYCFKTDWGNDYNWGNGGMTVMI